MNKTCLQHQYLNLLYEKTDGDVSRSASIRELAQALGISPEEGEKRWKYLERKGQVDLRHVDQGILYIGLTDSGADLVEQLESVAVNEIPESTHLPRLRKPRVEVEKEIDVLIDKGKAIRDQVITSEQELNKATREIEKWVEVARTLVLSVFENPNDWAEQFQIFGAFIAYPFVLEDEVRDFKEDMSREITKLETVREKIKYLPDFEQERVTVDEIEQTHGAASVVHSELGTTEISDKYQLMHRAQSIQTLMSYATLAVTILFTIVGIVLLITGAVGSTELTFEGVKLKTTQVGVVVLVLATVIFIFGYRRVISSLDKTIPADAGTDTKMDGQLKISDIVVTQRVEDQSVSLDFRVHNEGNSEVLINRAVFEALSVGEVEVFAELKTSATYGDLDISQLEQKGDRIEYTMAQVVEPHKADRFTIIIVARKLGSGKLRQWKLSPTLCTNYGDITGKPIEFWLPFR